MLVGLIAVISSKLMLTDYNCDDLCAVNHFVCECEDK